MAKPKRAGAKELQIRVSPSVHKVICQRTAAPGVEKWMVVESLMEAGLKAEAMAGKPILAVGGSSTSLRGAEEFGYVERNQLYLNAAHYLKRFFMNDVGEFMRTISRLHGDKRALSGRAWRAWGELKVVPEDYALAVWQILQVMHGLSRCC